MKYLTIKIYVYFNLLSFGKKYMDSFTINNMSRLIDMHLKDRTS